MRKTRLLSILALLLMAVSGAWAQDYYAPSTDEVIILNDVYDDSKSGYSSHSAIAWGGSASTSNKKAGDPNYGGQSTSGYVNCYSVKGTGKGKNITLSITGVSKVIVYHQSGNTEYIELRDGSKKGNIIGSGQTNTYYTEVALTATNKYSIFLHGTSTGSDDQDFYVYAIKLIAAKVRQPITTVRSWDFTEGGRNTDWESAQEAATSVWGGKDSSFRYSNANNLSGEELTDGTKPLKGLAGIYFTAPAGSLLLGGMNSSTRCLQTNGDGVSILLPDCAAKDRITIRFCASVKSTTVTITSDQMKSSYVANSTDRDNEVSAFVKENGNVVLNVPSKVRIYEIKVEPYVAVTNFNLSAETVTVAENRTVTVSATGFSPSNAFDKTLEWTTADENVATVANGVITGVNPGTTTITVTSVDGPSKTIGVTVLPTYTVTLAEGTEDAANWTIEPNTGLNGGETVTITYNGTKRIQSITAVKKAGATDPSAPTLSLTSPAVGQVIGSDGKNYAAGATLPDGVNKVAMIAYLSGSNGLAIALADEGQGRMNWATAKSTCEAKTPVFSNGTWKLPSQTEWKAMFNANGGSDSNYSGLNSALATAGGTALHESNYWSSTESDGDLVYFVYLSNGGASFNVDGKGSGRFVLACLAFTVEQGGASASVPVTAITLNKTETSIKVGSTETLSVTAVAPDNATDKTYTWKTSDETKATVDQDGKVTAVAAGTVTIYAEANDGSGVKGNCTVTVTAAPSVITWTDSDLSSGSGNSFTKGGITMSVTGYCNWDFKDFYEGGTFTSTVGKFTKIEVTAMVFTNMGSGWTVTDLGSNKKATWTGTASSTVSFGGGDSLDGFEGSGYPVTMVFTLE